MVQQRDSCVVCACVRVCVHGEEEGCVHITLFMCMDEAKGFWFVLLLKLKSKSHFSIPQMNIVD